MKIKLNLSEIYFIKLVLETFEDCENETEQTKSIAQDILNKIKK